MAIETYIGVNDVAQQVKKMYVGVNNVARKVKKAYIGVGGVARQFYRHRKTATSITKISGGLTFPYGLSEASTTQNDNYVLFTGCKRTAAAGSTTFPPNVFAFDKQLTMTNAPDLTNGDGNMSKGYKIGNNSLIVKQANDNNAYTINNYTNSLTKSAASLPSGYNGVCQGCSSNAYAFIEAKFETSSAGWSTIYTFAYNSSMTRTLAPTMPAQNIVWYDPENSIGLDDKGYFFASGYTNCHIIDSTLTKTTRSYSSYSSTTTRGASGATEEYVFYVGGLTRSDYGATTANGLAINKSGTISRVGILNARSSFSGASSKDFFVVSGGRYSSDMSCSKAVQQFNNNLTRTNLTDSDYHLVWNYGSAYWNGYYIFHNSRDVDNNINQPVANLYQEQFN